MKKTIIVTIIGTVIGGIILQIFPHLYTILVEVIIHVWQAIAWVWNTFTSHHLIPGYVIVIVLLFAVGGLVRVYKRVHSAFQEENEPDYLSYKEDIIHGARWRWSWKRNKISDLWCFCPTCDAQLAASIHARSIKSVGF